MSNERFASVWDAIEDTPEEAENMKLRSALMMALKKRIETAAPSQSQAAKAESRAVGVRGDCCRHELMGHAF